jgi:predicted nucleic acid-binding protein
MDKPTLYLETSVISYLAALPSRDPITARNQRITREWWDTRRGEYRLFTSEAVAREASEGDPAFAARRLALIVGIPLIDVVEPDVLTLAALLEREIPLPRKAAVDALHIAASAVHGLAYLLTWDSKHIANPVLRPRITQILTTRGWTSPILCTPAKFTGGAGTE